MPTQIEILQKFGDQAIKEMITRLTNQGHIDTGALRDSLAFIITKTTDGVKITFSAKNYAVYVDKGRKPGKFPPRLSIENWVKRKLKITEPSKLKQVTFLVRRKIALKGIAPSNFFSTTVSRKQPALAKEIAKIIGIEAQNTIIQEINNTKIKTIKI
jgi:hypothetical protein